VLYVLVKFTFPSRTNEVIEGKCFNTELVPLAVTILLSSSSGPITSSPVNPNKSAL